jgi:hypothetical protein
MPYAFPLGTEPTCRGNELGQATHLPAHRSVRARACVSCVLSWRRVQIHPMRRSSLSMPHTNARSHSNPTIVRGSLASAVGCHRNPDLLPVRRCKPGHGCIYWIRGRFTVRANSSRMLDARLEQSVARLLCTRQCVRQGQLCSTHYSSVEWPYRTPHVQPEQMRTCVCPTGTLARRVKSILHAHALLRIVAHERCWASLLHVAR